MTDNKPIKAEARAGFNIKLYCSELWIEYADGTAGEIDLSHLAGRGVFRAWEDPAFFAAVRLESENGAIVWGDKIDLCPDALYMRLTGKIRPFWNKNSRHSREIGNPKNLRFSE